MGWGYSGAVGLSGFVLLQASAAWKCLSHACWWRLTSQAAQHLTALPVRAGLHIHMYVIVTDCMYSHITMCRMQATVRWSSDCS